MALQIEFEDLSGVIHPKAYVRIDSIIIENPINGLKNISINVSVYTSKSAKEAGKSHVWGPQGFQVQDTPIKSKVTTKCSVDPDTFTIKDVYLWLKSQNIEISNVKLNFKESQDV